MKRLGRRALLLGSGAVLGGLAVRGFSAKAPVMDGTRAMTGETGALILNDASELSPTRVAAHTTITADVGSVLEGQVLNELEQANEADQPISIGAARHSMGAHAIPEGGRAITFDNGFVEPRVADGLCRVHAGARWSQVIAALDPLGYSPKVMQSNNDFGVAATFCVNAHGWPVPHGPMGSTVRAFQMIGADGQTRTCSRDENPDLFAMSMGGYGQSGMITELTMEVAPNLALEPSFTKMDGAALGEALAAEAVVDGVDMAYGRLNVERGAFFENALLISYRPAADQDQMPPASGSGTLSHLARHVFRAQLGNERAKSMRWAFETGMGPMLGGGVVTRNSLINEPVVTLDDRDPTRTDILHEYFIAPPRFAEFVAVCQDVIPSSYQELLNITLRYVAADRESWLSYAPDARIAAVMLFSQEKTARAEADMARMTRALIDRVLDLGGSYYLPYRPHASLDQFTSCYPRAAEFAAAKRQIDPDLRFRNGFWDRYLEPL